MAKHHVHSLVVCFGAVSAQTLLMEKTFFLTVKIISHLAGFRACLRVSPFKTTNRLVLLRSAKYSSVYSKSHQLYKRHPILS